MLLKGVCPEKKLTVSEKLTGRLIDRQTHTCSNAFRNLHTLHQIGQLLRNYPCNAWIINQDK